MADKNRTPPSRELRMSFSNPQAKKDNTPYRFDLRRLVSVRTINIVLTVVLTLLLLPSSL